MPKTVTGNESKELWLSLFRAETEEDLSKIEALEVSVLNEMVQAYRHVAASDEFKERERMRSMARHDEAQALLQRDLHWQGVLAGALAEKDAVVAGVLAEKDAVDAVVAEQAALIEQLRAQLGK